MSFASSWGMFGLVEVRRMKYISTRCSAESNVSLYVRPLLCTYTTSADTSPPAWDCRLPYCAAHSRDCKSLFPS